MAATQDFKAQLKRQLGFLEWSAGGFDAGRCDEAIRIATALRVIFHQAANSTSLLNHLNAAHVLVRSRAPDRAKQNAQLGGRTVVGSILLIACLDVAGHVQPKPRGFLGSNAASI